MGSSGNKLSLARCSHEIKNFCSVDLFDDFDDSNDFVYSDMHKGDADGV